LDLFERFRRVLARVDHDGLLATLGRDHPAVGLERTSREADDEHENPFRRPSGQPIGRSFRLLLRFVHLPA
jgi:hypothetical protein